VRLHVGRKRTSSGPESVPSRSGARAMLWRVGQEDQGGSPGITGPVSGGSLDA
jgi:hypothetical protein